MVAAYDASGGAIEFGKPRVWAAKADLGPWFDLWPAGGRFVIEEMLLRARGLRLRSRLR
jgi:hypothetical protein